MQFPASTAVTGRLQPVLNQCDYVQLLCWSAHTWYWRWIATQKKYLVSWIIEIWKVFFFFFLSFFLFFSFFVLTLTRQKWMRRGQWKGNHDETSFCYCFTIANLHDVSFSKNTSFSFCYFTKKKTTNSKTGKGSFVMISFCYCFTKA